MNNVVFINNTSPDLEIPDIQAALEQYGPVRELDYFVSNNPNGAQQRSHLRVCFESHVEAMAAVDELHGKNFLGTRVFLTFVAYSDRKFAVRNPNRPRVNGGGGRGGHNWRAPSQVSWKRPYMPRSTDR